MKSEAKTPLEYINSLPEDRNFAIVNIREAILKNIPKGFEEIMNYGMLGYVVPHSIFPAGYHCDPSLPLPFINVASQKNFIAFYHMGLYADNHLFEWFVNEYPKHSKAKPDMGKSCIRFKKTDQIPYALIGELVSKLTPKDWIEMYKKAFNK